METVTEVIQPWYQSKSQFIPPDRMALAGERGSALHRMIPHSLKPDEFQVERSDLGRADIQGYFISFTKWFELMVYTSAEVLFLEKEIKCDCFGFVGHIDIICVLKDGKILLGDWKTPVTEGPLWAAQLAAYNHLVTNHLILNVDRVGAIMLDPRGKQAKFKEYTKELLTHWNGFLSFLSAWRYAHDGR